MKRDSLFVDRWDKSPPHGGYDVFPDGNRFVMTRPVKGTSENAGPLIIVVNWPQLAAPQADSRVTR